MNNDFEASQNLLQFICSWEWQTVAWPCGRSSAVSQLSALRLENTTAIACWGEAHWHDVYLGNLVCHSVLPCFSRSVLCHYVWHSLSSSPQPPASPLTPELLITLKDEKFMRALTPLERWRKTTSTAIPRKRARNFKFISRQWKSEHLTENLSDSLNIYVDLFQLIDFLSMLLQKYVFCNAIRYKIAEKKSKRKIYLRSVMFTSCSALSPPSHFPSYVSLFLLAAK